MGDHPIGFRSQLDTAFLLACLSLALLSTALTAMTFRDHLRAPIHPALQICCLRILALAPVFALAAWVGMAAVPASGFLDVIRDGYEAYAVYCFWALMILWCGGQRRVTAVMAQDVAAGRYGARWSLCPLLKPVGCGFGFLRFASAKSHVRYWRVALLQWLVVKPLAALAVAVLELTPWRAHAVHVRTVTVLSTFAAMHTVFDTYVTMYSHLRGLNGEGKFLAIKALVAASLAQQVGLSLCSSLGFVPSDPFYDYSTEVTALRLLSTAIIIEMCIFSVIFSVLFSRRSILLLDDDSELEELEGQAAGVAGEAEEQKRLLRPMTEESTATLMSLRLVFRLWDVVGTRKIEEYVFDKDFHLAASARWKAAMLDRSGRSVGTPRTTKKSDARKE
ncbi:unnamed protein product [Pedinophyceae sp. YPF-701]|nr:unnamed protein product [Pedinophyceae sp. YPF-701]